MQSAIPQTQTTGCNFFNPNSYIKDNKTKRKNPQQGCTRMVIISRCICRIIRGLNPAPSNAECASFGAKVWNRVHTCVRANTQTHTYIKICSQSNDILVYFKYSFTGTITNKNNYIHHNHIKTWIDLSVSLVLIWNIILTVPQNTYLICFRYADCSTSWPQHTILTTATQNEHQWHLFTLLWAFCLSRFLYCVHLLPYQTVILLWIWLIFTPFDHREWIPYHFFSGIF